MTRLLSPWNPAKASQRLAAQRLAAQRLAAQRLAAQRLAAQRLAAQRLAAQRRRDQLSGAGSVCYWGCMVVVFCLCLSGCGGQPPLTVGSKSFSESIILGEMFAQLAEQQDIPVRRRLPLGNSFDCQDAIRRGELDIYAEYTGTGLALLGQPTTNHSSALQRCRQLYQRYELTWGEPLGFSNRYVLAMTRTRAAQLRINTPQGKTSDLARLEKISDLSRLEKPVAFACTLEFQQRPTDGLQPLVQTYGLRLSPASVVAEHREGVYEALFDGQVDVAVGYETDGQIAEFGLVVLEDDDNFFPKYEAVPLIHNTALEKHPQLVELLSRIKLTEDKMRELTKAVDVDGRNLRSVVSEYLVEQNLLDAPQPEVAPTVSLAVSPSTETSRLTTRALRAVRKVNPGRPTKARGTEDVAQEVRNARAFAGVLGADQFFQLTPTQQTPQRNDSVEAVAVVGYRYLHLITRVRSSGPVPAEPPKDKTNQQKITSVSLPANHSESTSEEASEKTPSRSPQQALEPAQKPAAQKPAAQKPAAQKPAAQKPGRASVDLATVGRIGVGPEGGPSADAARLLLADYQRAEGSAEAEMATGTWSKLFGDLSEGKLDLVIMMAELGNPTLMEILNTNPTLRVASLENWQQTERPFRFPFYHRVRIPAKTYPNQTDLVQTLNVQVVLVGPNPGRRAFGDVGPVSAVPGKRQRLADASKVRLREALNMQVSIDPTLPGRTVGLVTARDEQHPLNPRPEVSLLTFLALVGTAYLAWTVFRHHRRLQPSKPNPPN